jgi:hypothetical protein
MSKCRRDPNPEWNQGEAPDLVTQTPSGPVAAWFRPKSAPKPGEYDYSVAHRTRPGWRVYFLLLGVLAIPICCLVRLIATFLEGGL